MDVVPIVFGLVGGLALFLYGLLLLSTALQKIAGDGLKVILERVTNKRWKGVAVGAGITAIVQSSSVTTVTVIGLINAGLLTLTQAVPVIIGANIGTTITAQLVAFKIGAFAMPIIAIGFLLFFAGKNYKQRLAGEVVLGFGLLFLGMNLMGVAVAPLKESPLFMDIVQEFGIYPILGLLVGLIFTAVVQSSSATVALVIAMSMQGLIGLPVALPIILGADIGTCATVMIASIGARLSAKRAALAHLFFNFVGVLIIFPLLPLFFPLLSLTAEDVPRQIANAHTIFKLAFAVIFFPFIGLLILAVKRLIPGEEPKIERGVKFLDKRTLGTPAIAISLAEKEAERMGLMALSSVDNAAKAFESNDLKLVKVVEKQEDAVDELDNAIEAFLVKITRKELSKRQAKRVAALTHIISDIERVSDHANNIAELAERKAREKLSFSRPALRELDVMFKKSRESFAKSVNVMVSGNRKLAKKVMDLESEIDGLESQFEQNNFERTTYKKCNAKSSVVFADAIRNLERISDHAHNISMATTFGT